MVKLRRILGFGVLLSSLALGASITLSRTENQKQPEKYVETNLTHIMKAQEATMGIRHFGTPTVTHDLTESGVLVWVAGEYDEQTDTINLNKDAPCLSDGDHLCSLGVFFGVNYDLKQVIDHELGHYYTDKLHEHIGQGDWPAFRKQNNIAVRWIAEGIAEYFERTMNHPDNTNESDLPEINDLTDIYDVRNVYNGGYNLVKPIIKLHGRKGIEYLIQHPPTIEECDNLTQYQLDTLEHLAETP